MGRGRGVLWFCDCGLCADRADGAAGGRGRPPLQYRIFIIINHMGFLQRRGAMPGASPRPTLVRLNHIASTNNPIAAKPHINFSFLSLKSSVFIAAHSAAPPPAHIGALEPYCIVQMAGAMPGAHGRGGTIWDAPCLGRALCAHFAEICLVFDAKKQPPFLGCCCVTYMGLDKLS